MSEFPAAPSARHAPPQRSGCIVVLLIVFGLGGILTIGVALGLVYLGEQGAETSVYPGRLVPAEYVEAMRELGALDADEELLFFYTIGLMDIRGGFYFVSDRKVAIFIEEVEEPLHTIGFDEIAQVELERDTSYFTDSQITLYLHDEQLVWFPVSSEMDRDIQFADAIRRQLPE